MLFHVIFFLKTGSTLLIPKKCFLGAWIDIVIIRTNTNLIIICTYILATRPYTPLGPLQEREEEEGGPPLYFIFSFGRK